MMVAVGITLSYPRSHDPKIDQDIAKEARQSRGIIEEMILD